MFWCSGQILRAIYMWGLLLGMSKFIFGLNCWFFFMVVGDCFLVRLKSSFFFGFNCWFFHSILVIHMGVYILFGYSQLDEWNVAKSMFWCSGSDFLGKLHVGLLLCMSSLFLDWIVDSFTVCWWFIWVFIFCWN